ncbi:MAG: hypothetical protein WDW38_001110 [Sanguina aurantia]
MPRSDGLTSTNTPLNHPGRVPSPLSTDPSAKHALDRQATCPLPCPDTPPRSRAQPAYLTDTTSLRVAGAPSSASASASVPAPLHDQEPAPNPGPQNGGGPPGQADIPVYYLMLQQERQEREAARASAQEAARHLEGSRSVQQALRGPLQLPQQPQQQQQQGAPLFDTDDGALSFATRDARQGGAPGVPQPRAGDPPLDGFTDFPPRAQHSSLDPQHPQQQQQGGPPAHRGSPPWDYTQGSFAQNEGGSAAASGSASDQPRGPPPRSAGASSGESSSTATHSSALGQPGFDVSSSLYGQPTTDIGSNVGPSSTPASGPSWPSNIPGMEALMAANNRGGGRLDTAGTNSSEQLAALHKFLQFARVEQQQQQQQQQGSTRALQMSYANEAMHQPHPLEGQGPPPPGHQAAIQKASDLLRQRLPPHQTFSRTGSLEARQQAPSQAGIASGSQHSQATSMDAVAQGTPQTPGAGFQGHARQQLGVGSQLQGMRTGAGHDGGPPSLDSRGQASAGPSMGEPSDTRSAAGDADHAPGRVSTSVYAAGLAGLEQQQLQQQQLQQQQLQQQQGQLGPSQHHQRVSSSPGLGDLLARAQHLAAFGGGQPGVEPPRQLWHGGPGAPPAKGGGGRVNDTGRLMYGEGGDETAGGGGGGGSSSMEPPEGKPSRHLWLGNIPVKPNKAALEELFGFFGPLESVRVFPEKTFAFVNYISAVHAAAAKLQLDGLPAGSVTGGKQLVIRFQRDVLILPGLGLGHGPGQGRAPFPDSASGTRNPQWPIKLVEVQLDAW